MQSKIVVIVLVALVAVGIGAWFFFDASRPVLDREVGRLFAAEFEKRCQRNLEESACKAIGGANHATCLASSASRVGDEVVYDREAYLECMEAAAPVPAG